MGVTYWIAQGMSVLSTILLLYISLAEVSRKVILVANMVISGLLAGSYFLLQSWSGGVCSMLCVVLVGVFYFKERFRGKLWVPLLFAAVFITFGIVTWQNWVSLIPVLGHLLLVVAFWKDDEVTIKTLIMIVAAMWVIYNLLLGSWFGAAGQFLSFMCNFLYVFRHRWKKSV